MHVETEEHQNRERRDIVVPSKQRKKQENPTNKSTWQIKWMHPLYNIFSHYHCISSFRVFLFIIIQPLTPLAAVDVKDSDRHAAAVVTQSEPPVHQSSCTREPWAYIAAEEVDTEEQGRFEEDRDMGEEPSILSRRRVGLPFCDDGGHFQICICKSVMQNSIPLSTRWGYVRYNQTGQDGNTHNDT